MIIIPLLMSLNPRAVPVYSAVGAVLTVAGFFGWAGALLGRAPKQSSKFVWATFINNSGYGSYGWVFIMGFYNSLYGLYGTDAMLHMVEEMRDAAKDAPVSREPLTTGCLNANV